MVAGRVCWGAVIVDNLTGVFVTGGMEEWRTFVRLALDDLFAMLAGRVSECECEG